MTAFPEIVSFCVSYKNGFLVLTQLQIIPKDAFCYSCLWHWIAFFTYLHGGKT